MGKQVVARFLLLSAFANLVFCYTPTVPAFIWSNNPSRYSGYDNEGSVNYNIISPGDLAKNVLNMAGWSQILCSEKKRDEAAEVALVFIGSKLRSQDISRKGGTDAEIIELLKESFKESDFSMAFPYVALSEDRGSITNSLLSGFMKNCDHGFRNIEIAVVASCSVEGTNIKKLSDLKAVNEYVNEKKQLRTDGDTNLIFVCSDKSPVIEESGRTEMESKNLANILMDLKQSGIAYSVLYTSDPYEMAPLLRFEKLERLLIANASENTSTNVTYCDIVCQSKASMLEGFLVGLVLLIILLFGLSCMMGIETPTRFEAPHES
ncbi:hypothetical protein SUGI_1029360 [Cryptomeria japonica]|uniref:uncharacterized protein LOC131036695 n=1 Tax=Cryptomeria japonica TaxID=3369 RepID=UPI0024147420|nr:uncharacterized protein LOC131036695 [Cryptomeria japonica]GLJ48812.1 hypothetical protein SUGI_1029360 [Cryptomeria japonica]